MAELVTLTEDGSLGKAGTQVWVDDAKAITKPKTEHKAEPHRAPAKKPSDK